VKQYYKNPYTPSLDLIELVERASFNVDAITLIVEKDSDIMGMKEMWDTYKAKAKKDGYKLSLFLSHGYKGASISSVRYGFDSKRNRAMFSVTGRDSQAALVELIELDGYSTRVDLAATFILSEPVADLAKFIHEARVYVGNTSGVKISDYKYISGRDGDTLYIGNRNSAKMLRIYDKSYEYSLPRGTVWRWEIQYSKEAAKVVWEAMDGLERNSTLFKNFIARTLFEDCHRKGVRLPIEYHPAEMSEVPPTEKGLPDRERYLKWMRETVSPVVKWMTARGEIEMVLEALGIQSIKYAIEKGDNILAVISEVVQENVSRETMEMVDIDRETE